MNSFIISLNFVCNCCIIIIISSLLQRTYGVPDDYCLAPLNKSDCGQPVTAVFSYYLPGSRCEIEFWRGCPTTNKFPNEVVCSHYCIGALIPLEVDYPDLQDLKVYPEDNLCDEEFNADDCKGEPAEVFTYNKTSGLCLPVTWRGCESRNRFAEEEDCKKVCESSFLEDIGKLKENQTEYINKIIANMTDGDGSTVETTTAKTTATETTTAKIAETATATTEDETTDVTPSDWVD